MFGIIILLECELLPKVQTFCRFEEVFYRDVDVFRSFNSLLHMDKLTRTRRRETAPEDYVSPSMLHSREGMMWIISCVGFASNVRFGV